MTKSITNLQKAHFVRVELLEGNIFSDFTAVYKTQNSKLLDKAVYCIGNLKEKLTKATYIEFVDSLLTNEIANKLNLIQTYTLEGKHYIDKTKKDTISVINLDKSAQIIEKMNSEYKSIYESKVSEQIFKLTFIPITRNSKPILLTESMEPETDNGWNSVLVYDGTKYVESDRQRIKN